MCRRRYFWLFTSPSDQWRDALFVVCTCDITMFVTVGHSTFLISLSLRPKLTLRAPKFGLSPEFRVTSVAERKLVNYSLVSTAGVAAFYFWIKQKK